MRLKHRKINILVWFCVSGLLTYFVEMTHVKQTGDLRFLLQLLHASANSFWKLENIAGKIQLCVVFVMS